MAVIVVVRRFFRGLAQGQAEMKKTGSKRVSGYEAGLGSAVLEAPEESYAPETESRTPWQVRGPAPAGALQRGYGKDGYGSEEYEEPGSSYGQEDSEYVPRRGSFRLRYRGGVPRTIGGRIVLGVVAFAILGAVGVAFAGVRYYLMHDSRFLLGTSDDIQIVGAQHLTRDQVLNVFGADLERNIFRASLAERRADLERLPWVEHATVMRLLPNQIRVQITERMPVAFVRQGTQIGLVDAGGVLLDMPPDAAGDPHYSFPVLTGLSASDPVQARVERMQVYGQFMKELGSAGEQVTDSLSEVDVSDPEDVKALIASGSSDILVHFGHEEFLKRYHEFEQNLPQWKLQYPKLASADMRYEGQVVLEMQNGQGATSAADASTTTPATDQAAAASSIAVPAAKVLAAKLPAAKVAAVKVAAVKVAAVNVAATRFPPAKMPVPVVASMSVRPAVSRPTIVKELSVKAATPKPVMAKASKHAEVRSVAKSGVKKKASASGMSAANQKVFAALAAAHRAALAKAAAAKTARRGGVTP